MTRDRRRGTWTMVGAALFLLGAAVSIDPSRLRRGPPLDGETGQVLAAYSLARDHDLRYDRGDLAETAALFGVVPAEVALARTASGELRYVASGLEPWLVSWLLPWLGVRAFPIFHAAMLLAAATIAWWRAGERSARDAAWVLTALAASALPLWLLRFSPEAYRAGLVLAGVAILAPRPTAEIEDPWTMHPAHGRRAVRAVAGGALLGLALWELGISGVWLVLVPLVTLPQTMGRERHRVVLTHAAIALVALLAVATLLHLAPLSRLRSLDPSRMSREARVFTNPLPHVDGADFASLGSAAGREAVQRSDLHRAFALRDAFVGRFSGVVWWFPCAGVGAAAVAFRRPRPWRLSLIGLAAAGLAAHALRDPAGFAGPSDGPGAALAASLYPLVVVAGIGVVGLRSLVTAWMLAGVLLGEPLTNPLAAVREPALHARSAPYTWMPLDMSRVGRWPGGRPLGAPLPHAELLDVRENIDVVISPCDLVEVGTSFGAGCFWTPDEDVVEILVWQDGAEAPGYVVVHAGPVATEVAVALGDARMRRSLAPGETVRLKADGAGDGFPAVLHGRSGWAWILRVSSSRSFQPALAGVGRGRYWLGVEVGLARDPD